MYAWVVEEKGVLDKSYRIPPLSLTRCRDQQEPEVRADVLVKAYLDLSSIIHPQPLTHRVEKTITSFTSIETMTVPSLKLNDGTSIPIIGFGTGSSTQQDMRRWQAGTAHFGNECTEHVLSALKVGYRYLDGAEMYANSGSIRDALKAWDGKREDVYVLTKCMSITRGELRLGGVEGGVNDPREVLEKLLLEVSSFSEIGDMTNNIARPTLCWHV
jgi:hypothetical protein